MSPEALLAQFDAVADAPDGVQRLRELILQLAARGKLVPQDPDDEPASVLLERIEAEKQRLYAEGKIGKPKKQPSVELEDVPFEVPCGWVWVRIGSAMELINGRAFKPAEWSAEGLPIIRIQNLNNEAAPFNYCDFEVNEKFRVRDEDLLISWSGTPGTSFGAFVWRRGPAVLNQHIFRCEVFAAALENDFARIAVNTRLDEMIDQAHGGVGLRHITKGKLENVSIVLPPLLEQRRIVAKVDELMSLCDELEERQRRRVQQRDRVNRASLHHLSTAADDDDLADGWVRIRENFGLLYDAPETVTELRQAVLQLAVRGKLVPQDPNDEPASVLLERIEEEKQRLYAEGRIGKLKRLAPMQRDEMPFDLPDSWKWVRFGDVSINRDAERIPVSSTIRASRRGNYPYYGASGVIDHIDGYLFDERLLLIGEDGANLILRSTPIAFLAAGKYWVNNHAHVIDASEAGLLDYLGLVINATDLRPHVTGTAQPKLNQAKLNSIPVGLPPLLEQRRIVEKVNQLMSICDELEAKLTRARAKSERVAASVVHHLAAA